MRVGISLNMLTKEGRSDLSVLAEHLAPGNLAEPLGFDSLFTLEHHFPGVLGVTGPHPDADLLRGAHPPHHAGHRRDRSSLARPGAERKDEKYRKKATEFYVKIQVVGTPDDYLQPITELQRLTGLGHLVGEFGYGGMPTRRPS